MSASTTFINYKVMRGNKVLFIIALRETPAGTGMVIPLFLDRKRFYIKLPYRYLRTDIAGNIYQIEFALDANRKSDRQLCALNDAYGVANDRMD